MPSCYWILCVCVCVLYIILSNPFLSDSNKINKSFWLTTIKNHFKLYILMLLSKIILRQKDTLTHTTSCRRTTHCLIHTHTHSHCPLGPSLVETGQCLHCFLSFHRQQGTAGVLTISPRGPTAACICMQHCVQVDQQQENAGTVRTQGKGEE